MSQRRVVVTGMGIVSPVGNTLASAWDGITQGRSGIGPLTQFDASALKPPVEVAPRDSSPAPCLPAARAPVGETWLATAISTLGRE